jgi:hypothetical protein
MAGSPASAGRGQKGKKRGKRPAVACHRQGPARLTCRPPLKRTEKACDDVMGKIRAGSSSKRHQEHALELCIARAKYNSKVGAKGK